MIAVLGLIVRGLMFASIVLLITTILTFIAQ